MREKVITAPPPRMGYCGVCFAGKHSYPTAILHDYADGEYKICNNCGTVHDSEKMQVGKEIRKYQKMVETRLESYTERDTSALRPIIVPLIWSLFQKSHRALDSYDISIISTNCPFFLSFGLHNLGTALGGQISVGSPPELWQAHQEIAAGQKGQGKQPIMVLLMDTFEKKHLDGMNPSQVCVLCVTDLRSSQEKKTTPPIVYKINE